MQEMFVFFTETYYTESDLDLEIEGSEERPPAYDEIHHYPAHDHKETAI